MSAQDLTVPVEQLLQTDPVLPHAGWYATPLNPEWAATLHVQAQRTVQQRLAAGILAFAPRLAELITGFWSGRAVIHDYRSLIATQPPEFQALAELIYGQLLVSRRLSGSREHLDRGFTLAVPYLAAVEYFVLLRRHELLCALPLGQVASAPQTLPELLTEARVIRRLQPPGRRQTVHPHDDTLG